jgi:23S rRNA maturation-related 3'-5' exoribonuclease YhaM
MNNYAKEKFDKWFEQIGRVGKYDLLGYLEKANYFTAPASTQYHGAKESGLLEHSVNVTELLWKINTALDAPFTSESIAIVGLFHDIGKTGYYGKPNYVENILKSGKRSESKPYEINKDMLPVPHEVSAIHILSKYINLTEEEVFAILYHNGLYTPVGYGLKGNERKLQTALHFADMWASRFVEVD